MISLIKLKNNIINSKLHNIINIIDKIFRIIIDKPINYFFNNLYLLFLKIKKKISVITRVFFCFTLKRPKSNFDQFENFYLFLILKTFLIN